MKPMILNKARQEKDWPKQYRHYWLVTLIYVTCWVFFILMGIACLVTLIGMFV